MNIIIRSPDKMNSVNENLLDNTDDKLNDYDSQCDSAIGMKLVYDLPTLLRSCWVEKHRKHMFYEFSSSDCIKYVRNYVLTCIV